MKLFKLVILLSCIALHGCPELQVLVSTDKQHYSISETVEVSLVNESEEIIYIDSCNPVTLYKSIQGGEIAVDSGIVCIHNNARPVQPGETVVSPVLLTATGNYRAQYDYGLKCAEGVPISENSCNSLGSQSAEFSVGAICTEEYAPVCGSELKLDPCNDDPSEICAITEIYKSYSNTCMARSAGSPIFYQGTCEEEGTPIEPKACAAIYDPVCGLKTEAPNCDAFGCNDERQFYRTYGNECEARNDAAYIVFEAECGQIEGQEPLPKVTEPVSCIQVYDPVCGVSGQSVKVYGNSCEAGIDGAYIVPMSICL